MAFAISDWEVPIQNTLQVHVSAMISLGLINFSTLLLGQFIRRMYQTDVLLHRWKYITMSGSLIPSDFGITFKAELPDIGRSPKQ